MLDGPVDGSTRTNSPRVTAPRRVENTVSRFSPSRLPADHDVQRLRNVLHAHAQIRRSLPIDLDAEFRLANHERRVRIGELRKAFHLAQQGRRVLAELPEVRP